MTIYFPDKNLTFFLFQSQTQLEQKHVYIALVSYYMVYLVGFPPELGNKVIIDYIYCTLCG